MRRLLLIGLALALMAGCKKSKDTGGTGSPPGGVVQGVKQALDRTVIQSEMRNLQTTIATLPGEPMPTVEQINAELKRKSLKSYKLVQDKAIVLTGTRSRDHIWAYTADAQAGSEHLVLTESGVDRMTKEQLDRRLEKEKGP
jgi:hypothetical protein